MLAEMSRTWTLMMSENLINSIAKYNGEIHFLVKKNFFLFEKILFAESNLFNRINLRINFNLTNKL